MTRHWALLVFAGLGVPRTSEVVARPDHGDETVMVAAAAHDLAPGTVITRADLHGIEVPRASVSDGVFLGLQLVLGRTVRERVLANEPVRGERLADAAFGSAGEMVAGTWMTRVAVTDALIRRALLEPGRRVRVAGPARGLEQPPVFDVRVRSVDEGPHPTATLLLTTEEAEQVFLAERAGPVVLDLPGSVSPEHRMFIGDFDLDELRRRMQFSKTVQTRRERDCGPFEDRWPDGTTETVLVDRHGVRCP